MAQIERCVIDILRLPQGWIICKICGENPVPPLADVDYGIDIGVQVWSDPNPVCEQCYDKGYTALDDNKEDLPF